MSRENWHSAPDEVMIRQFGKTIRDSVQVLVLTAECRVLYSEEHMIRIRRGFDPHSIKLVIFDLDGTLIDSRLDLVHSVNAALRHIHRPELPEEVIASYVGDGAPILIQRALGGEEVDEALVRKGLEFFLSYYREHKLDHTTVYPGIQEALGAIQSSGNGVPRKMAVLSNKPVNPSRAIVESLGLGGYFSQIYGGNSFGTKKPEPEGALKLVSEAGVRPEQAAIVGDSHVDIRTGRNAGLWTVAVTYGFAPHTLEAEAPDLEVDTPQELGSVFRKEVELRPTDSRGGCPHIDCARSNDK